MKTKMEKGYALCYLLFGGDFNTHTILLYNKQDAWLKITHTCFLDSKIDKMTRKVNLSINGDNFTLQEIPINFNIPWNKFCLLINGLSSEFKFTSNNQIVPTIARANTIARPVFPTDMIQFRVLGMLSQVILTALDNDMPSSSQEGVIHNWNMSQWIYDKAAGKDVTNLNLLGPQIVLIPFKQDIYNAYNLCQRLGNGLIAQFDNEIEWKEWYNYYKKIKADMDYVHFPLRQDGNKVFNFNNDKDVTDTFWLEKCLRNTSSFSYIAFNGTGCTTHCTSCMARYYYFCNFSSHATYRLHGKDQALIGDQPFFMNFRNGDFFWHGLNNGTYIKYSENSWIGKSVNTSVSLRSNATFNSLLVGKSSWTIFSSTNAAEKPQNLTLMMHACKEEEFVCDDGACVAYEQRCNGLYECPDNSDEKNCTYVRFPEDYNNEEIVPRWGVKWVDLDVNLHLLDVLDLNINSGRMDLKLNITLKWYDFRLKYVFLNNDTRLNVLDSMESEAIWKPSLIYSNKDPSPFFVNVKPEVSIGLEKAFYKTEVNPVYGGITQIYDGYENPLYWTSVIR